MIPYILALLVIGIPLLVLEVAVGQYYQAGNVGAFGSINTRFRGIGLASVMNSFLLNCYYTTLIGVSSHKYYLLYLLSFKLVNTAASSAVTRQDCAADLGGSRSWIHDDSVILLKRVLSIY